uniref:Thioredoxin H-type 5 n=1 Tax=Arundo donax TaxID=35708 RepID=A0A0A9H776_ARUDO
MKMASVKREAISLKAGSMKRHGPHHDAEKSITISLAALLWASHCSSQAALEWAATTAELGSSAGAAGIRLEKKEPIFASLALLVWLCVGFGWVLPSSYCYLLYSWSVD